MPANETETLPKPIPATPPAPNASPDHPPPATIAPVPPKPAPHHSRKWIFASIALILLILAAIVAIPAIHTALTTVSTDDAYVNGHATFVAPRVAGQVTKVLVEDNNRVKKGDLIVQLDPQPYQAIVNIKASALASARSDLEAARADVRALEAQARSKRWKLQHSIEDVNNQIALLKSNIAALDAAKAVATRASSDLQRALTAGAGAVSASEIDKLRQVVAVSDAQVKQALQAVYQNRVSLGLEAQPKSGDLAEVPPDLDQTFSSVRQAQAELIQTAAQIGVISTFDVTPKQMLEDFYKRDPQGNIDRIYAKLLEESPPVIQAKSKVDAAQRDLEQAQLNLNYCNIYAEIDGVITRRNVNPGNNVIAGQELMAIRSLTDIWIDANFKETELAELKIGQPVDLHLDMYGKKKIFKGRISGFTMGTGSSLALLPAQNATGNFVKVVQRLPVRIDIENYNPETDPLFVGTSVVPHVLINEQPTGPSAGKILQPYTITPTTTPSTAP